MDCFSMTSAGYVPQNDLTAVAVALYGIVCIIFWMREPAKCNL